MRQFALLTISVLMISCGQVYNSGANKAVSKLDRITVWRDSTGFLELPFKVNFNTTTNGTFRVKFWETDSIFRDDFKKVGDIYLMGMLPDTTNFYAVVFLAVGAFNNPGVITLDKSGNKVDLKILTREKCVMTGDMVSCEEYATIATIEKGLTLAYYFQSIEGVGDSDEGICSQFKSKGQINEKGEIELGLLTKTDCNN
jgi:hypothetical protein